MDEGDESGTTDVRAPWERPVADPRERRVRAQRVAPPPPPVPVPPPEPAEDAPAHDGNESPVAGFLGALVPRRRSAHDARPDVDPDAPTTEFGAITDEPSPRASPQSVGSSDKPATRLAASRERKRKRWSTAGRGVVAFASVLVLLGSGLVWGYLRTTEAGLAQIAALDTDSTDIVDPVGQTGDETYLIVGTDTRAGVNADMGAGTAEDAEGARADTVILVNIPADRSRVVAVSFPRDLDVERPVCAGWDSATGEYSNETFEAADGDKLNATYALGGPKCLVKVIQKMSGLRIGHFVGIDFAGFETMVDKIGGVDVCTTTPLVDGELGTIIDTPGTHRLAGSRALDYVRARKVEAEGNGDYGRIARQQKFLASLLRASLSNNVLLDPGKLNGFVQAFTDSTFVENVDTSSLVKLGRSLQNVDAGAVTFLTVPTAGTNEWGNEIPRSDDIRSLFRAIIDDEPLPGEDRDEAVPSNDPPPTAPPAGERAVDPSTVSVQVSNASGVSGLAAGTADSLGAVGFGIVAVGNYTSNSTRTVVRYGPSQQAEAMTLASAIPDAVLQPTDQLDGVVELVLGSNATGVVRQPTPSGTDLPEFSVEDTSDGNVELPADLAYTNAGTVSCD